MERHKITTPEDIEKCKTAGKIAAQVRREGAAKFKIGASFLEVMDYCENRIKELGGGIAWAQMAVNDVAAHYCPTEDDDTTAKENDLIKIDIGVHIDGLIADNAMTVEVGSSSSPNQDLIKASQNALRAALKIAKPGTTLAELGEAQFSEAEALGFTTVTNLCGHTIAPYTVHAGISIPTFNNKSKVELEEGWQIAIEPFVTDGQGLIKEKGPSTVFMTRKNAGARSPYARKIIEFTKPRNGLPFTTRDLTREFGKGPAALGLRELQRTGAVTRYPPLAEVTGRNVAQFEHSAIVKDTPLIYTRLEEDSW